MVSVIRGTLVLKYHRWTRDQQLAPCMRALSDLLDAQPWKGTIQSVHFGPGDLEVCVILLSPKDSDVLEYQPSDIEASLDSLGLKKMLVETVPESAKAA